MLVWKHSEVWKWLKSLLHMKVSAPNFNCEYRKHNEHRGILFESKLKIVFHLDKSFYVATRMYNGIATPD